MTAALATYSSFDLTKTLFEFQRPCWEMPSGFLDLCKKIGAVALSVLLFIPALLADLAIMPISFLYRMYYPSSPPIALFEDPRLERLENSIPPFGADDRDCLRIALTEAFLNLNEATKREYKDLIENDGVAEEGDAPIEIFKWSAEVLLVHYLRCRYENAFPANDQRHAAAIAAIWASYNQLSPREKATVCLKLIDMQIQPNLNQNQLNALRAVQNCALDISRNPNYNQNIYRPVANEVQNL